MAIEGADVVVSEVTTTGCARAGLLYVNSTGDVAKTRASSNRFGIVLQGEVRPTVHQDCLFSGNSEQDEIASGDLPIPDRAPPLP